MVALGGGIGSLARHLATTFLIGRFGARLPLATMAVNVTGCFLIGLIMTTLTERLQVSPLWRALLVIGFLGGYTTFSSFEWETYTSMRAGSAWIAVLNVVGSVTLGYAAVWLGAHLARR